MLSLSLAHAWPSCYLVSLALELRFAEPTQLEKEITPWSSSSSAEKTVALAVLFATDDGLASAHFVRSLFFFSSQVPLPLNDAVPGAAAA